MKFWVKAITDKNVQEQLLVDAGSLDELTKELSSLLNTCVTSISVSDFQAQVVDKINSGADMVTVNIATSPPCAYSHAKPCGSVSHFDSSSGGTGHWHLSDTLASHNDDDEWLCSTTSTVVEGTPVSRSRAESQLLWEITPQIDRICLRRDQIELLLRQSHGGAYYSVVTGCFVRMRWRQGYSLYQIVRPVSNELLVFDMIHYEEMHGMEVVSNAPPVAQEVSTWGKRMRAASRPFVTPGFIEAKVGDVDSALRTARGVSLDRSVLQPHTMITPSTPPVSGGDSYVRRARKTITAHSHSLALFSFDRLLLRTNDTLLHSQVCVLCEPERDNFNVVIFASRLSNTHAGKPRRSDFAGCMITLDKDSRVPGVSADRDITEKGYEMLCPPQWWGRRYIALGRQRPAATNVPYCDSRGTWRQDYTVLSGRFLTSLFNPPTSTSLPLPLWACGEGVAVTVMRPHLVVHHKKLHVFYLIQVVTTPSVRSVSGDRSSFCETLNPSAVISILPVDDVEEERCGLEVSLGSSDMSPQSNAPSSAAPTRTCQYGLAHAVCEEDAFGQWKIISEKEPVLSCRDAMPIFTVASLTPVDSKDVRSSSITNSPDRPSTVLHLLWYEEGWMAANQPTPAEPPTDRSVSNRPSLPFERWVNPHEDVLQDRWSREPSYSTVRIDVELMTEGLCSLSLCEHEGTVVVVSINKDSHRRTAVLRAPLTAEP